MSDYYVRKDGSDSNPGTTDDSAGAKLTVMAGLGLCSGGDTLHVGSGTYDEDVETLAGGSSGSAITVDGHDVATIKAMQYEHAYNTVQNMEIKGKTVSGSWMVHFANGANYGKLINCVVDSQNTDNQYGVMWESPSAIPFGVDAASNVEITGVTIQNIYSHIFLTCYGDDNVISDCVFSYGNDGDFVNVFGRRNTFRDCVFRDMDHGAEGNHPDLLQVWGNHGFGSIDHLFDRCRFQRAPNCALGQLSRDLMPDNEIGNWEFRNCLFEDIGSQLSNTGVGSLKFYNCTFVRCNPPSTSYDGRVTTSTGGWVLGGGYRYYDDGTVVSSGEIVADPVGQGYRYRTESTSGTGTVTYDGVEYEDTEEWQYSFYGVEGVTTFTTTGDAVLLRQSGTSANNLEVLNCAFLNCGDDGTGENNPLRTGYYSFDSSTTGHTCDYNIVSKGMDGTPWLPVDVDSLEQPTGDPDGWDTYRWWETNGINGGDPGLVDYAAGNFTPDSGSILIGAGTDLSAVFTDDINGETRSTWDIGAFSYQGPISQDPPNAPTDLTLTAL